MFLRNLTLLNVVTCLLSLCLSVGDASADLRIGFSPDGLTNEISANVGDTVTVPIYAVETETNKQFSELGLFNMGLAATFNKGLGNVAAVNVNSGFYIVPEGKFDNNAGTLSLTGGTLAAIKASAISLGQFTFTPTSPGKTTFVFGDIDHTQSTFATKAANGDALDLDPLIFGASAPYRTFSVSINAVPEPSSFVLALFGFMSVGLFIVRKRYRRPA